MRAELPRTRLAGYRFVLPASAFCLLVAGAPILGAQPLNESAPAQAAGAPAALVFFAQHRMPETLWRALFAAMRANLPELAEEIPAIDANPALVRGDTLAHGDTLPQGITVYLHGDCGHSLEPATFVVGVRLGWVLKVGERIEPVIHVECAQIAQEISWRTEWMTRDQREAAMAEALARVILHEWAHIALQSAVHGPKGITKAGFGVDDLLPGDRLAQVPAHGPR